MRGAVRVDGNAIAGMLAEVLGGDITSRIGVCDGCGAAAPLAEAVVELDDRAAIVVCRSCTMTLLTVLRSEGRLILGSLRELSG